MDLFAPTFLLMGRAMLQILLVAALAGVLVRRAWVTAEQVRALAAVTVNILLPCMIFTNLVRQFDPRATPGWLALPLLGVAVSAAGLLLARLVFWGDWRGKKLLVAMSALQNAAYMSLPIGRMVYPDQFDRFAMYCFLFILGYSPVLWSVGKRLATQGAPNAAGGWRGFVTPPFVANVAGVAVAALGWGRALPGPALDAADLLGSATVPLATFVLGATVGGISFRAWPRAVDAARAAGVKLFLLPAAMITALGALAAWTPVRVDPLLGDFLVIQAAAPPATALVLQVRKYGGDAQQAGALMLLLYSLCLATLPLWVALWRMAAP